MLGIKNTLFFFLKECNKTVIHILACGKCFVQVALKMCPPEVLLNVVVTKEGLETPKERRRTKMVKILNGN